MIDLALMREIVGTAAGAGVAVLAWQTYLSFRK
jgi:hypothetical protein